MGDLLHAALVFLRGIFLVGLVIGLAFGLSIWWAIHVFSQ